MTHQLHVIINPHAISIRPSPAFGLKIERRWVSAFGWQFPWRHRLWEARTGGGANVRVSKRLFAVLMQRWSIIVRYFHLSATRGLNTTRFEKRALPVEQNWDRLCNLPGSRLSSWRNSANGPVQPRDFQPVFQRRNWRLDLICDSVDSVVRQLLHTMAAPGGGKFRDKFVGVGDISVGLLHWVEDYASSHAYTSSINLDTRQLVFLPCMWTMITLVLFGSKFIEVWFCFPCNWQ